MDGRCARTQRRPLQALLRAVALLGLLLSGAAVGASSRVAVVNDIAGHFEVLAGVLTTLRDQKLAPLVLYVGNVDGPSLNGLHDWIGKQPATWQVLTSGPSTAVDATTAAPPTDMVVCVSAELAPHVRRMHACMHAPDLHSCRALHGSMALMGGLIAHWRRAHACMGDGAWLMCLRSAAHALRACALGRQAQAWQLHPWRMCARWGPQLFGGAAACARAREPPAGELLMGSRAACSTTTTAGA